MSVDLTFASVGCGRPVVLLHPVGLDRACWRWVCDILADRYRLIAVDLRGHGLSPKRPLAKGIEDHADDLARLLTRQELSSATLVGVSFGGIVAQMTAVKYPALISKLVPCACPARIAPENRAAIIARGTRAMEGGMPSVVKETLARWFSSGFLANPAVAEVADRLATDDPDVWAATWHAIAEVDILDRLTAVSVPTLAVAGENDEATPIEAMKALTAAIAGARLDVLPDAPHMLHIETARAFTDVVTRFLEGA
jgi:3-oxoadipate enol-lactonase